MFIENYAKKHNGTVKLLKVKQKYNFDFNFTCKNNHNFKLNQNEIENNLWCKKCIDNLNKIKEFIKSNKGKIGEIDDLNNEISIYCKYNHFSKFNYNKIKNLKRIWCSDCKSKKKKFNSEIFLIKQNEILENFKNKVKKIDYEYVINYLVSLKWIDINDFKNYEFYKNYITKILDKTDKNKLIKYLKDIKKKEKENKQLFNFFKILIILFHPIETDNQSNNKAFLDKLKLINDVNND